MDVPSEKGDFDIANSLSFEPNLIGIVKQYADHVISHSTFDEKDNKWNSYNYAGIYEIFDPSLKAYSIEIEFPLKLYPQLLLINDQNEMNKIKFISLKNLNENKWHRVWDTTMALNEISTNIYQLNIVNFKTNQVRFELENGEISSFLKPFSIEIQGIHEKQPENPAVETPIRLLNDDTCKDVSFLVEDKEINAHQCILALYSSHFREFFKKSNETNNTKKITIQLKDVKLQSFELFILYFYTKYIDENAISPETLLDLYSLSLKYNVFDLKHYVIMIFNKFLTDKSCIMAIYELTVDKKFDDLIELCLKAISDDFNAILEYRINSLKY